MAITLNGSTGISSAGNVLSAGNVTAGNVLADNYYYGNGTPFSGGGASTGNVGFSNVTMYSLNGLAVNNSDLSHGSTSGLNIPSNGSGTAELFNTYGDVNIIAGTGPSHTYNFGADGIAELGQIVATGNIVGGNLNTGGVVSSTGNIIGANVNTGGVVSATGNVRGSNLNTAGIVSATGNITGGNVVTTGNVTGNYFIGNGSQLTGISAGANTGNVGFDNNNIYNTQGGGLILSNFNYVTAEAETAYINIPAGNSPGDLQIVQEQGNITLNANSSAVWSFNADSTLRFPNNSNITIVDNTITEINAVATANSAIGLRAFDAGGNTTASSFFDGADGTLNFYSYNSTTDINYNWHFDNGGSFTLPNSPGNVYFGIDANQPVIIPEGSSITLSANRADAAQDYIAVTQDGIELFSVNTININNSTTGFTNSDINLRSGDDILLQGRDRPADEEREGGDLFIYGGNGSDASTNGFDPGGGGDLLIEAGLGGAGTGTGANGGSGGQIGINAGNGGTTVDSVAGSGGSINITAGAAATPVDPAFGGWGGDVTIRAGETTRVNENGGSITLWTGGGNGGGTGAAGYVEINIPSSNVGPGGSWTFSGTGTTFQVPADSEIYGASYGNFTVGCAGNTIVTSSDYGINPQNWVFGYTGTLTLPGLANISGGNFNAGTASATVSLNAFSPDGNTVSIQAQGNTSSAVISIFANAGPVTNDWVFTHATLDPTEPLFYVPGGAAILTPEAAGGAGGKNIFIEAGAADQQTYNTSAGGELMLKGGRGATNDGGGGGPGGNVNINAGESADPAGHAGNVNITAGALQNWVFNNNGDLRLPGSAYIGAGTDLVSVYSNAESELDGIRIQSNNATAIFNQSNVSIVADEGGSGHTWTFDNTGNLTAPGAITATSTVSGLTLVSTQSAANEGGEIQLALPSSGTTLTGNIIIDSYQNLIRFFESGNSRGLYVDVPNVSVSGQYAIGYRDVPQIALSGNVTANSITAGKHFYSTTAGNLQITIPDNANVAFPLGATLTVVMNAAGNVIVAQGTGVSLYMAGSSTTGNRTVGAYGLASVMKVATDTWVISGTGVY